MIETPIKKLPFPDRKAMTNEVRKMNRGKQYPGRYENVDYMLTLPGWIDFLKDKVLIADHISIATMRCRFNRQGDYTNEDCLGITEWRYNKPSGKSGNSVPMVPKSDRWKYDYINWALRDKLC